MRQYSNQLSHLGRTKILTFRFYLFLERGEGRDRNISVQEKGCLSHTRNWAATQACALIGNQTFQLASQHPVHWATSARAKILFLNIYFIDYAITVVPFTHPSLHSIMHTPSLPHSSPIGHVHGSYR